MLATTHCVFARNYRVYRNGNLTNFFNTFEIAKLFKSCQLLFKIARERLCMSPAPVVLHAGFNDQSWHTQLHMKDSDSFIRSGTQTWQASHKYWLFTRSQRGWRKAPKLFCGKIKQVGRFYVSEKNQWVFFIVINRDATCVPAKTLLIPVLLEKFSFLQSP